MRIEIEIPKEFEEHFARDRFRDSLSRLRFDAGNLAGLYEKEVTDMLITAFSHAKIKEDYTCGSPYTDRSSHGYSVGVSHESAGASVRIPHGSTGVSVGVPHESTGVSYSQDQNP